MGSPTAARDPRSKSQILRAQDNVEVLEKVFRERGNVPVRILFQVAQKKGGPTGLKGEALKFVAASPADVLKAVNSIRKHIEGWRKK